MSLIIPLYRCFGPLMGLVVCLAILAYGGMVKAGTLVFSCRGESGEVLFQQNPCVKGPQKQHVLEDYQVGWKPVGATPERTKVKRTGKSPQKVKKESAKSKQLAAESRRRAAKEEKCFNKQQALENVNRRLRRGYKPSAGKELRHKRRQYEAYLSKFCK